MKEKILKLLGNAHSQFISGVEMSNRLGISRVAVWKHMKRLVREGYDIDSSPKGYRLNSCRDLLGFSLERGESAIRFFPVVDSTMDRARELARQGAAHFTVVLAEQQEKGRGRLNRSWFSQKGGLWFTIILKPDLPPQLSFKLNFTASLCLARTLNRLFDIDARVKWPNDILVDNKKLVGLLSEMETRGDMISFVNIGIGINVNNRPEQDEPNAVAIRTLTGREVSRKAILGAFLDDFEAMLQDILEKNIIDLWKEQSSTIGKRVRIETLNNVYKGVALDVDESGALILQQADNTTRRVIYGDCFHRENES
ncbi:MAG: biotin--[acetyl-CoA-carboxylase] ligase [Desulfobacteraceae bacterium]|nr:biotin--[acetyl-CoA-carboxylase] ligase [Desulfobacteraceae bacterium]